MKEITHCYKFSHSELCILLKLPDVDIVRLKRPIEIFKAPPGINSLPQSYETLSEEQFEQLG